MAPSRSPWRAVGLAALCASAAAAAEGRIIDRAVALVGGQVITLSELELEARVTLIQAGGVGAAKASLDQETLRAALDLAIGYRLEVAEADKLQAHALEEGELEAALKAFAARFSTERELQQFLDRHEADLQTLAAVLARSLRAAKILDGKLRLKAQVSEAELRRHYEAHRAELGASYEELRGALRQKLVSDRLRGLTAAELERIRRSGDVRLLGPFAQGAAEGPR